MPLLLAMSGAVRLAALALPQQAAASDDVGVAAWLDAIIGAVGLGIAGLFALHWLVYVRRDPLELAPTRTSRLGPEGVFITAGAYILAASALALMFSNAPPSTAEEARSAEDLARTSLLDSIAKLVGTMVGLIVAARAFDGGLAAFIFGRGPRWRSAMLGVAVGIASLPLCYLTHASTLLILRALQPDYQPDPHTTIQLLLTPGQSAAVVASLYVGAGLIAPLGEEVFFRGLLQTQLSTMLASRWIAVLFASACFALVHAQVHAFPALFLLSVLMGASYERTGAMLAPFLVHAIFNGKTLLWNMIWPSTGG